MSDKKPCQFCCWLRQQLFNLLLTLWFIAALGHTLYFAFSGKFLFIAPMEADTPGQTLIRFIILVLIHAAGIFIGGTGFVEFMLSCSLPKKDK